MGFILKRFIPCKYENLNKHTKVHIFLIFRRILRFLIGSKIGIKSNIFINANDSYVNEDFLWWCNNETVKSQIINRSRCCFPEQNNEIT